MVFNDDPSALPDIYGVRYDMEYKISHLDVELQRSVVLYTRCAGEARVKHTEEYDETETSKHRISHLRFQRTEETFSDTKCVILRPSWADYSQKSYSENLEGLAAGGDSEFKAWRHKSIYNYSCGAHSSRCMGYHQNQISLCTSAL